jgi:hypothetical protein
LWHLCIWKSHTWLYAQKRQMYLTV